MLKTLSSKGQLVLPAAYRRRMGLSSGSEVRISEDGNRLVIEPTRPNKAKFVQSPNCARPIISVGADRQITDADLIDPLDDDA